MVKREQKVGVFVDVQNMFYSARSLYNARVDFRKILKKAVGKRKLVRAITYVIESGHEEEEFFHALENMGYELRKKKLKEYPSGKKGDWDMGIAIDAIELSPKIDVAVLVSGDGDFKRLLAHLKTRGVKTEVLSFGKSTSGELIEEADEYLDLGKKAKHYLLKK